MTENTKATETTPDPKTVDIDELKTRLKDTELSFGNRSKATSLIKLAQDNGIEVPIKEKPAASGNVVPTEYRAKYGKEQNCGDDLATALADYTNEPDDKGKPKCSPAMMQKVAEDNGVLDKFVGWSEKNLGMQRMNLGNVLRGKFRRGEVIMIGDTKFHKPVEENTAEAL